MELTRFWAVAEDGHSLEIAVRPHLVDELMRHWPVLGLDRSDVPVEPVEGTIGLSDTWLILPDEQESGDSPSAEAWDTLDQVLNGFAAERLVRPVAIHAATIEWNGRLLLVPAGTGSGKSTLAVAAAAAGARVLSDEYALVDPGTGLTTGWPRPVRVDRGNGPELLPIAVESEPLPVGLVALLTHEEGLTGPASADWEAISPGRTVTELLMHTLCARTRTDDALTAALAVARSAPAISGTRGEADEIIEDLLALVTDGRSSPGPRPTNAS